MEQLFPALTSKESAISAYDGFHYPEPPAHRPYVLLNFVLTLDGQATLATGGTNAIGSSTDHRLMRELRATVEGLLHGAGTVRAHDFAPIVPESMVPRRLALGLAAQPLGAVVTRSGQLDPDSRYFSGRPPIVFTTGATSAALAKRLGDKATVVGGGSEAVDVPAMLEIMRRRFGLRTVLCEGGPQLAHGLLAARCLDELFVTIAPKIGSDRSAVRLVEGPPFADAAAEKLKLVHLLAEGSELFLRYRVL